MELGTARTVSDNYIGSANRDDRVVEQRLGRLLKLNAETAREKSLYRTEAERRNASLMTSRIDSKKAYSYFGLMIGALPPYAMVFSWIGGTSSINGLPIILVLLSLAATGTGLIGYSIGRFIPAAVSYASRFRFPNRVLLLSLIGAAWGAVSGAIGGLFLFVVGSIFAAIIGGLVGAIALPILVALLSTIRQGDFVEMKHFLPIAFGITLTLCALIVGS